MRFVARIVPVSGCCAWDCRSTAVVSLRYTRAGHSSQHRSNTSCLCHTGLDLLPPFAHMNGQTAARVHRGSDKWLRLRCLKSGVHRTQHWHALPVMTTGIPRIQLYMMQNDTMSMHLCPPPDECTHRSAILGSTCTSMLLRSSMQHCTTRLGAL